MSIAVVIFLLFASFTIISSASVTSKKAINEQEKYNNICLYKETSFKDLSSTEKPVKHSIVLIPPNSKIKNIDVNGEKKIIKNSNVYENILEESSEDLYEIVGNYYFRGYQILFLNIFPLIYNHQTNQINFYETLEIDISLEEHNRLNSLYRGLEKDRNAVLEIIENTDTVSDYRLSNQQGSDLLIITTESLKDSFEPLKQYHNQNGINTDIYAISSSQQDPESIKNIIKNSYIQDGIEYVLLGADEPDIPVNYVEVYNPGFKRDELVPSDQWYTLLDEDEDDLAPEVFIGRACVDTPSEASNFVDKTISFLQESNPDEYDDIFLLGEKLATLIYGADFMNEFIDTCVTNYETNGIPSTRYNIQKMYDKWETWDKAELINMINTYNPQIINHLGHSLYDTVMKMKNSDVKNLNNNQLFFLYSQGCLAGGFDNPEGYDCIGEELTVKSDKAAVAAILNSRYGIGTIFLEQGILEKGSNHFFHREFWDLYFDKDITNIGKTNQFSKIVNINRWDYPGVPYAYWQITLFGDPTISLKVPPTEQYPKMPDPPSFSGLTQPGIDLKFSASTIEPNNNELYYLFDWDDGSNSGWIGPNSSGEPVEAYHSWSQKGTYLVKVKAKNAEGFESTWSIPISVTIVKSKDRNNLELVDFINRFPLLRHLYFLFSF